MPLVNQAISELTELAATPDVLDLVALVDVSDTTDAASGTTKKNTRTRFLGLGISTKTDSNYVATDADDIIFFDLSAGTPRTLTLETAANRSRPRWVKNLDNSTADLTIDGDGSETVDGSLTILLAPGDRKCLIPRTSSAWESI